jgi:hypothetical protein
VKQLVICRSCHGHGRRLSSRRRMADPCPDGRQLIVPCADCRATGLVPVPALWHLRNGGWRSCMTFLARSSEGRPSITTPASAITTSCITSSRSSPASARSAASLPAARSPSGRPRQPPGRPIPSRQFPSRRRLRSWHRRSRAWPASGQVEGGCSHEQAPLRQNRAQRRRVQHGWFGTRGVRRPSGCRATGFSISDPRRAKARSCCVILAACTVASSALAIRRKVRPALSDGDRPDHLSYREPALNCPKLQSASY